MRHTSCGAHGTRNHVIVLGCTTKNGYACIRGTQNKGDIAEPAHQLDIIRARVAAGKYMISFTHTEKLRRRCIRAQEIEDAIASGAIIEDYPSDSRGPSCLLLGYAGTRPLHIVCGRIETDEILIITAYQPDPNEWEADWTTRKR